MDGHAFSTTLSLYASSLPRWNTELDKLLFVIYGCYRYPFEHLPADGIVPNLRKLICDAESFLSALLQPYLRLLMWIYRNQEDALYLLEDFVEMLVPSLHKLSPREDC